MLLGAMLYLGTLDNPFVFDDMRTVVDNGSIASLRNLSTILRHEPTRPLTNLSFAFDRAAWGPGVVGHHVTGVALHLLNILLVFLLIARTQTLTAAAAEPGDGGSRSLVAPFVGALVFASHPVMTEAVGYVSSRSDLLCTTFVLTAALAALAWLQQPRTGLLAVTWLAWVAALLSKETAAGFPLVVLACVAIIPSVSWRRASRLLVPLVAAMGLAGMLRLAVFFQLEGGALAANRSAAATLLGFWHYVLLLVTAAGQSIHHAAPDAAAAGQAVVGGAVMLMVFGAAGMWLLRRRAPLVCIGAAWFVVLLAPALLLGATAEGSLVAEHRAYLPVAGFSMVLGAGAAALAPVLARFRSTRILGPMAVGAIVLMLSGRTLVRNELWADPVSLWQEAAMLAPSDWLPHAVLGEALHAAGRHDEAVQAFVTSTVLRADNDASVMNLAICLLETGRRDEATARIAALEHQRPTSPFVPVTRGAIAAMEGRRDEARAEFERALERDGQNVVARQWLAVLAEQDGDASLALHHCYELQRLIPARTSVDDCIARMRAATAR